jgi:hypothetical protein
MVGAELGADAPAVAIHTHILDFGHKRSHVFAVVVGGAVAAAKPECCFAKPGCPAMENFTPD